VVKWKWDLRKENEKKSKEGNKDDKEMFEDGLGES